MFQTSFCGTASLPLCRILCFKLTTEPPKEQAQRWSFCIIVFLPMHTDDNAMFGQGQLTNRLAVKIRTGHDFHRQRIPLLFLKIG